MRWMVYEFRGSMRCVSMDKTQRNRRLFMAVNILVMAVLIYSLNSAFTGAGHRDVLYSEFLAELLNASLSKATQPRSPSRLCLGALDHALNGSMQAGLAAVDRTPSNESARNHIRRQKGSEGSLSPDDIYLGYKPLLRTNDCATLRSRAHSINDVRHYSEHNHG